MICLYPVYLGNFGTSHKKVLNEYLMILGAILNRHLTNVKSSNKDSEGEEQSTALLYQLSIEARRFDIHQNDKLNLSYCYSISEMLEQMNSLPYSSLNRERLRLIARFIKGQTKLKKYSTKESKQARRLNRRHLVRGVCNA